MSRATIHGVRIAGVATCVPATVVDNLEADLGFAADEVRKVASMAGVLRRHVVADGQTATDLSTDAAAQLLARLGWAPASVDALVLVTQSPDHFLPSSACLAHQWLGLSTDCAAFDVGLGCSGYPYGLYLASAMLNGGGHRRVLLLHGETPSRFVDLADHATTLLFGDAGSATALELCPADGDECGGNGGNGGSAGRGRASHFVLHTDGSGHEGLIIRGGAFRDRRPADPRHLALEMDGAAIFNFTLKRVPPLVRDALELAGRRVDEVDHYVFHQSNRFIIRHLMKKCGLPEAAVPLTLADTANCGGPSVPVTMTRAVPLAADRPSTLMLLGYGVGLSWAAAVVTLDPETVLMHSTSDKTWTPCAKP